MITEKHILYNVFKPSCHNKIIDKWFDDNLQESEQWLTRLYYINVENTEGATKMDNQEKLEI